MDIRPSLMDLLLNAELQLSDGSLVSAKDTLMQCRVIAVYFSAQWCGPCRSFTPVLRDFYETMVDELKLPLQVVFVSADLGEQQMRNYHSSQHGAWPAVPFSCQQLRRQLAEQLQAHALPTLVFLRADGSLAQADGKGCVVREGPSLALFNRLAADGATVAEVLASKTTEELAEKKEHEASPEITASAAEATSEIEQNLNQPSDVDKPDADRVANVDVTNEDCAKIDARSVESVTDRRQSLK